MDGGQGKDISCIVKHLANVMVLEEHPTKVSGSEGTGESQVIRDMIARGNYDIRAPIEWKISPCPIVFHERMHDAVLHLPDCPDNNK